MPLDATIDDEALVRMFHQCGNDSELVKCVIKRNDERALRLLIAEKFRLSEMEALHFAYGYGGIPSILMLSDAGFGHGTSALPVARRRGITLRTIVTNLS
jgi:hypothetical protein